MQKVFICVRKITFDEKTSVLKPVNISVGTIPRLIAKSFPANIKMPSLLTCQGLWTCHPTSGYDDKLLISLVRGNKILASVVIPLSWLPKDQVVETWFPMKLQNHKTWKHAPMALITMHYDTLGKKRFNAPKGDLTVTPGWKSPQKKNKLQLQQNLQQQIMGMNSQQINQQPILSSPQQIAYPAYYNQYPQFPPQYAQNSQFVNYPITPQQMFIQPQYQIQHPIAPQVSKTPYIVPRQCVFSNDDDIPQVNYPKI